MRIRDIGGGKLGGLDRLRVWYWASNVVSLLHCIRILGCIASPQ
jgi:hypothetical protein